MEPWRKKILIRNLIIILLLALAILLFCSCTIVHPILGFGPSRLGDLSGASKVIGILPSGNYLVTSGVVKEYMELCMRESSYDDDLPHLSLHAVAEAKTLPMIVQKHESKCWQEFDYEGIAWEVYPAMVNRVKAK